MGQVTIYIDEDTEKKMIASARAKNVSKSKWVSGVIRDKLAKEWPASVRDLAGSWAAFPSAESLRDNLGQDAEREKL